MQLKQVLKKIISKFSKEQWLIIGLLVASALTHSINLFRFPAYFDDEGTYLSQAWSVVNMGKLSPYTYWYDHAPLGWMLTAAWAWLTGGFFTFGTSINSARVFMVVVQVLNTYLLYKIAKKLVNVPVALLTSLLFIFSPLAITLHRMYFLDNIMVLFILLSLMLIVKQQRLYFYFLSGILFGLAALVKESAPFFLIPFLLVIWHEAPKSIRPFALFGWLFLAGITIAFYPTYALLKGELLSPGEGVDRVSLIKTLLWQASRKGGFFLSPESEFRYSLMNSWLPTDPLLVFFGTIATAVNALLALFFKKWRFVLGVTALLSVSYVLYLIRGGIINDQYIIPLLPFLALNIAVFVNLFIPPKINYLPSLVRFTPAVALIALAFFIYKDNTGIYTLDQTKNQVEAIRWVKENVPVGRVVAIDAYALVDLFDHSAKDDDLYSFKGPQHYWKLNADPEVYKKILGYDWKQIEYVIATGKMRHDLKYQELKDIKKAYDYSYILDAIENDNESLNKMYGKRFFGNVLIAKSDTIEVRKIKSLPEIVLHESWAQYKKDFIVEYGQVFDPTAQNTTSEGQSYAMLRSVWMDDPQTFQGAWQWAKDHFQHRDGDKLLSWIWAKKDGKWQVTDANSASDADVDIALALILAGKRWENQQYTNEAKALLQSIWDKEVVRVNGRYLLVSSNLAKQNSPYLVNPSYFSPAHYRVFQAVDPTRDWNKLADDSYYFLEAIQKQYPLPPNWVNISSNGLISSAEASINKSDSHSYDAFRTLWRVGLDHQWFKTEKAKTYLASYLPFYKNELQKGLIAAEYSAKAEPLVNYKSTATLAAPIAVGKAHDPEFARVLVENSILTDYDYTANRFIAGSDNYYAENWGWFALALYNDSLSRFGVGGSTANQLVLK